MCYPIIVLYTLRCTSGRGSDDASAKRPGGSPPKPSTTSVTTVALADGTVTLRERFPRITHTKEAHEAATAVLAAGAADVLPKAVVQTALRVLTASQLSTEAARVQVAGLVSGGFFGEGGMNCYRTRSPHRNSIAHRGGVE